MHPETIRPSPEIPAATMVGSIALVLGRAETRMRWEASPEHALRDALDDHPVGPRTEAACRALWSTMLTGDRAPEPETIGQTLHRLGLLRPVLRRIREAYRDDLEHRAALEQALDWTSDCAIGRDLRLLVDAFSAYAGLVHDATGTRVDVSWMVEAMLVMVVG